MNSTFSTASERSLWDSAVVQVRFTHRLSRKEQERRILFVRNKLLAQLVSELGLVQLGVVGPKLLNALPITYNRNRMRVNSKMLVVSMYNMVEEFKAYREHYKSYWKTLVAMRQLSVLMKAIRRNFGSNVLEDGVIRPTRKFYLECLAHFNYRKNWNELKHHQRAKIQHIHSDTMIPYLMDNHPFGQVLKDSVSALMKFKNELRMSNHLIVVNESSKTTQLSRILDHIPAFDMYMIGYKRLTDRQLSRLRSRSMAMAKVDLFNLLFNNSFIEKSISISHDLRFVARLTVSGFYVYKPFVQYLKPKTMEPIFEEVKVKEDRSSVQVVGYKDLPLSNMPAIKVVEDLKWQGPINIEDSFPMHGPLTKEDAQLSRSYVAFHTPSFVKQRVGLGITLDPSINVGDFAESLAEAYLNLISEPNWERRRIMEIARLFSTKNK